MRRILLATVASLALALPVLADQRFEAMLAGQAILPGAGRNGQAGSVPAATLPG